MVKHIHTAAAQGNFQNFRFSDHCPLPVNQHPVCALERTQAIAVSMRVYGRAFRGPGPLKLQSALHPDILV